MLELKKNRKARYRTSEHEARAEWPTVFQSAGSRRKFQVNLYDCFRESGHLEAAYTRRCIFQQPQSPITVPPTRPGGRDRGGWIWGREWVIKCSMWTNCGKIEWHDKFHSPRADEYYCLVQISLAGPFKALSISWQALNFEVTPKERIFLIS